MFFCVCVFSGVYFALFFIIVFLFCFLLFLFTGGGLDGISTHGWLLGLKEKPFKQLIFLGYPLFQVQYADCTEFTHLLSTAPPNAWCQPSPWRWFAKWTQGHVAAVRRIHGPGWSAVLCQMPAAACVAEHRTVKTFYIINLHLNLVLYTLQHKFIAPPGP